MIPEHKILAIVAAVAVALLAVLYGVLLYPRQARVAEIRARKQSLVGDLEKKGWPLDPSRLASLHSELKKEQDRFGTLCNQVMDQASTAFADDVARFTDGGPDDFRDVVTLLDYREEYTALQQSLQGRVQFDESVLGLGESSDSIYVYRLLLQLWTVKDLTDLALQCRLRPVPHPTERHFTAEGQGIPVSQVSVRPFLAYSLHEEKRTPYLLEFPVRLTLSGTVADMGEFLQKLQRGDRFFPLSRIEVRKVVPPKSRNRTDRIEMTVECSSFFRLESSRVTEVPDVREKKLLPPGA